jgi:hypothetical protein
VQQCIGCSKCNKWSRAARLPIMPRRQSMPARQLLATRRWRRWRRRGGRKQSRSRKQSGSATSSSSSSRPSSRQRSDRRPCSSSSRWSPVAHVMHFGDDSYVMLCSMTRSYGTPPCPAAFLCRFESLNSTPCRKQRSRKRHSALLPPRPRQRRRCSRGRCPRRSPRRSCPLRRVLLRLQLLLPPLRLLQTAAA